MNYKRTTHLAWRIIGGKAYIVDTASSVLHELDDVGTTIWESLASPASVDEIAARISAEYEVSEDDARKDVSVFLEQLVTKGIVTK